MNIHARTIKLVAIIALVLGLISLMTSAVLIIMNGINANNVELALNGGLLAVVGAVLWGVAKRKAAADIIDEVDD